MKSMGISLGLLMPVAILWTVLVVEAWFPSRLGVIFGMGWFVALTEMQRVIVVMAVTTLWLRLTTQAVVWLARRDHETTQH